MNPENFSPRHTGIKIAKVKDKERNSKQQEKTCYVRGNPNKTVRFLQQKLYRPGENSNILKVMKEKTEPRIL